MATKKTQAAESHGHAKLEAELAALKKEVAALKKHLKEHGPHKVDGVKYEQRA